MTGYTEDYFGAFVTTVKRTHKHSGRVRGQFRGGGVNVGLVS